MQPTCPLLPLLSSARACSKLFVGLFLNTGIILLVVNANLTYFIADLGFTVALDGQFDDFVFDWFSTVGVSLVLTMFFNMFNPHIFPLLCVPYRSCRRSPRCVPAHSSQGELNRLYAGEDFDLAERYAALLNTVFVTLLYAPGLPLLYWMAALTFLLQYWFDKVSFLRLYRLPPRYDHTLASTAVDALPYALIVHCAMAIWFYTSPVVTSTTLIDLVPGVQNTITEYQGTARMHPRTRCPSSPVWICSLRPCLCACLSACRLPAFPLEARFRQTYVLPLFIILLLVVARQVLKSAFGWVLCAQDVDAELMREKRRFRTYREARAEGRDFEAYALHKQHYYHDAYIRTPSRAQLPALRSLEEEDQMVMHTARQWLRMCRSASVDADRSPLLLAAWRVLLTGGRSSGRASPEPRRADGRQRPRRRCCR
jgi:hypothetical protein